MVRRFRSLFGAAAAMVQLMLVQPSQHAARRTQALCLESKTGTQTVVIYLGDNADEGSGQV